MRAATLIGLLLPFWALAQTAPDTWWIQFTDKAATPYSLSQPEQFLSHRAIQRRITQGIPLDEMDLPVDPAYINTVLALGEVQLVNRSKWFNAITVRTTDPAVVQQFSTLPFVQQVRGTRTSGTSAPLPGKFDHPGASTRDLDYGVSFLQVSMMNGHLLHELSQGEGMLVGVLDSGFEGVDWIPAFAPLHARNGIVLTRDMVVHDGDVYMDHWHGRSVLSCMAAIQQGELVGTAPQADYVLLRTEDAASEYIVEEDNWVAGAELCDSLGCDILNTSLGYTRFDDPTQDHTYADLDGNTTRISIAAAIASSRGMIPVTGAGNQGESDWFFISAPADAPNTLAVGAVGGEGQPAPFSSHGPSADGRVKPDVSAMGWGTIGLGVDGVSIAPINGTSFSAPLVAGLVACLWQLHPLRTNLEIMAAVRQSASHYAFPEIQLGHGIPDFMLAHEILVQSIGIREGASEHIRIFPVPFDDRLEIITAQEGVLLVSLYDLSGREVWSLPAVSAGGRVVLQDQRIGTTGPGSYVLLISSNTGRISQTILKL